MSQYKDVAVGSTVYFWFAANETDGDAGDGADPLYDVRLAGAASDAAPTASGSPTLLSHANYGAGLHEIAIDTTGYTPGSEYAVFCSLTISAVNPSGFVGSFVVRAASSTLGDAIAAILGDHGVVSIQDDIDAIKTKTDSLTFTVAGDVDCNVQTWKGAAAPDISDDATIAAAVRDVAIAGAAAGSIGETISTIGTAVDAIKAETDPFATGTIVDDVGNSNKVFMTNLAADTDDKFNRCLFRVTSGAMTGEMDKIIDYDGTNKIITLQTGLTAELAAGVTFAIENQ